MPAALNVVSETTSTYTPELRIRGRGRVITLASGRNKKARESLGLGGGAHAVARRSSSASLSRWQHAACCALHGMMPKWAIGKLGN